MRVKGIGPARLIVPAFHSGRPIFFRKKLSTRAEKINAVRSQYPAVTLIGAGIIHGFPSTDAAPAGQGTIRNRPFSHRITEPGVLVTMHNQPCRPLRKPSCEDNSSSIAAAAIERPELIRRNARSSGQFVGQASRHISLDACRCYPRISMAAYAPCPFSTQNCAGTPSRVLFGSGKKITGYEQGDSG